MIITSLKSKFNISIFKNKLKSKFTYKITNLTILCIMAFCLSIPLQFMISEDFIYENNIIRNLPLLFLLFTLVYSIIKYKKTKMKEFLYGIILSTVFMIYRINNYELTIKNFNITKNINLYLYILLLPILFLIISIYIAKSYRNNTLKNKITYLKNIKNIPIIECYLLIVILIFNFINNNFLYLFFLDEYQSLIFYILLASIYYTIFIKSYDSVQ